MAAMTVIKAKKAMKTFKVPSLKTIKAKTIKAKNAMKTINSMKAMKTFEEGDEDLRTAMKKVMKKPSNKTMPAARQGGGNATVYKLKAGKKVSQ